MAEYNPEDSFGEGLNAPNSKEKAQEFGDRADAFLRWKQKTAYVGPENIIGGLIGYSKGKQQKARGEEHNFGGKQVASLLIPGGAGYQIGRHMGHSKEKEASKTASVRQSFISALNPTSAASSVNAQSGELVVKTAEMEDPRAVLAGKPPEKGLPKPAMEKDIESIKNSLLGTVDSYRDLRTQLTSGNKEKQVRLPKPPAAILDKLKLAGRLDFMKDPTALTAMGIGGALGGGGAYLANRPKKNLGGKSSGEVDLENLVSAQKARGEEGASFPRRLKNRYVEFSKGLATDFRKSPGSAAAMGAISGAAAGALAAKMLGAGK